MDGAMKFSLLFKLLLVPALVLGVLGFVVYCHRMVEAASQNRLYANAQEIPPKKAALVLGCASTVQGRTNLYFHYRITAAAALFHAGKCEYLIVSGDNSRKSYDEPTDMQNALVKLGVPESRIYRDFAGFRTLDSIVRAREIFGQTDLIIVSQPFHNKRAIYLAKANGIEAVGLNCKEVNSMARLKTRNREYLARVKMVLDVYLLRTAPKFLGPKVVLGEPPPQPD
jgi:SanA protein